MRILMIGDVKGKPGRRAIQIIVPAPRQEHGIGMVIADGENTSGLRSHHGHRLRIAGQ